MVEVQVERLLRGRLVVVDERKQRVRIEVERGWGRLGALT